MYKVKNNITIESRQRGFVLVVGLVFMLTMTVIGLSAMQATTVDERMAGNLRDRNLAFQAAEAALLDAETWLRTGLENKSIVPGSFTSTCALGLCSQNTTDPYQPYWKTISWASDSNQSKVYSGTIPSLSAQPRYIIENGYNYSKSDDYLITVRAQGINPNTVIWLQSVWGTP